MWGAKVEWYRDSQGEVGRINPTPANWVSIDLLRNPCALEIVTPVAKGRK